MTYAEHDFILANDYGEPIIQLADYVNADYNIVVNGVGSCTIVMPGWNDPRIFHNGQFINCYRRARGKGKRPTARYTLEKIRHQENADGVRYTTIEGLHVNGIMGWRIGNRDVRAIEAVTAPADDWMKGLVRAHFIDGADDDVTLLLRYWGGRDLSSVYNFTVEPDHSLAPSYSKDYTTALVIEQISNPPKSLSADEIDPYWLFWEVVWDGDNAMEFRTYHGARLRDRRVSQSRSPILLEPGANTISEADWQEDHTKAYSLVFAGAMIEGDERVIEFSDEYRLTASPAARREKYVGTPVDARGVAPGDTADLNDLLALVEPYALKSLREGRPASAINGKFKESVALNWGEDLDVGDMATIRVWNKYQDVRVGSVSYSISSDGEVVDAKLEPMTWNTAVNA